MRVVQVLGAAVLISALAVPAYCERAQREGESGRGHEKQAERQKPDKGQKHSENKAQHDRGREQHGPQRAEHAKPAPRRVEPRHQERVVRHAPERPQRVQARYEHRAVWQQRRAQHWATEHHTWVQRGGYHGFRVPRERYTVWFGPAHHFRLYSYPVVVVAGHPRFHYQGYWVSLVDPWPEYWAPNWYETDDVYVAYVNDGYYLYNVRHPGVAVAVNISF